MRATVTSPSPSKEVHSLDEVRLSPAKAGLDSPTGSNSLDADRLSKLAKAVKAALVDAHGSGQAASIELGIDQSQMNRQLAIGTFDLRALAAASESALAMVGERLVETFGAARKSKKAIRVERAMELLALMVSEDEA